MPELPEVQTIKSQLTHYLPLEIKKTSQSKVISSILHTEVPNFKDVIITSINRHGKCLIFNFDSGLYLLSHLGMTGSWRISEDQPEEKHLHFQFDCGSHFLSYVDPRRFGHMYFFHKEELETYLKRLGPDIDSEEFNKEFVWQAIKKYPNRDIKPFLLEQKFFAGSGNYIANEVCALSKIHPEEKCNKLNKQDAENIVINFKKVIHQSIASQGVTFQGGYSDAFGEKGNGVGGLVVFHQKRCQMCNQSEVLKIVLKQRGTFYCPSCQKLKK